MPPTEYPRIVKCPVRTIVTVTRSPLKLLHISIGQISQGLV